MLHVRSRDSQDDPTDHRHEHDHGHDRPDGAVVGLSRAGWLPAAQRFGLAAALLVGAGLAASAVTVSAGEAIVVTEFGAVTRVITEPGLAWKAPAPIEFATGSRSASQNHLDRIAGRRHARWTAHSGASLRRVVRAE